jgi:pimeloyl-ACP methyl ester carboxylesterase
MQCMVKTATNGDVTLAYETFGAEGRPILLLTGAAAQLVMWPMGFCQALVRKGFHVARMDSRGTGRSTNLAGFTADDIADDVIAVLDDLGWSAAILLGWSEGGGWAKVTALRHPERVAGLVSLGSGPVLRPWITGPRLVAGWKMFRVMSRRVTTADEYGQLWVDLQKIAGSPGYPLDAAHWREAGRLSFPYVNPDGDKRLAMALFKAGDLRKRLRGLGVPTLVLHGEADPVVLPKAGRETAKAVPGARLVTFPGMGHDLPSQLWPRIVDEISRL